MNRYDYYYQSKHRREKRNYVFHFIALYNVLRCNTHWFDSKYLKTQAHPAETQVSLNSLK